MLSDREELQRVYALPVRRDGEVQVRLLSDLCKRAGPDSADDIARLHRVVDGDGGLGREIGVDGLRAVAVHTKNGKLCICISNPCAAEVVFENGLPKTGEDGHGFGAKSIQRVVDKSGGVCRFRAENGVFEFTAVL